MRRAVIAAIEADMAKVALASKDLEDLETLALLALQRGLLDEEDTERVFEALGRVRTGLGAGRKWMRAVRDGREEWEATSGS